MRAIDGGAGAAAAVLVTACMAAVRSARAATIAHRAGQRFAPSGAPARPRRPLPMAALPVPGWVAPRLAAMGFEVAPAAVWWGWTLATAMAALAALQLGGPGLALLSLAASAVAPVATWRVLRTRRDVRLEGALPAALEAVARGLRSGASLRLALAEAAARGGHLGADLARVTCEAEHGADLVAAVERWGTARPLPGVRLAVAAVCLGAEAGGPQARAIDGVAATLRQRLAVAAEARALAAQARMSALVIALSPLVFCALAAGTDPRTARFLFNTAAGQLLLAAGLGLDVAGGVWMAHLTGTRR